MKVRRKSKARKSVKHTMYVYHAGNTPVSNDVKTLFIQPIKRVCEEYVVANWKLLLTI